MAPPCLTEAGDGILISSSKDHNLSSGSWKVDEMQARNKRFRTREFLSEQRFHTCAEYSDRRQPSLRAMEEIAWVLRSDPKKNQVGFVRRSDLTRRERFAYDADPLDEV
jgi:hypothetical protein